jgi:hypothetical protein
MVFILAILLRGLVDCAFAGGGIYLISTGHPTAGGWLIAAGIISLLCTSITHKEDDKKENIKVE